MIRFALMTLATALAAIPGVASAESLSLASSFRIGSGGVICTAQSRNADPRLRTMFDRGYAVVCRDAASAVGRLFVFRGAASETSAMAELDCQPSASVEIPGASEAQRRACVIRATGLTYAIYTARKGRQTYVAEGLAGYDSALRLGLVSLIADKRVPGDVEVAVTDAGDAAAFARVQAGNLDPDEALAEGYGRNNEGAFAESAEFFETLVTRNRDGAAGFDRASEYLANQALQQSNLGNRPQADRLFRDAIAAADFTDPLIARLIRNFQAIHALNRSDAQGALTTLSKPLEALRAGGMSGDRLSQGFIDEPLSQRLNRDDDEMVKLGGVSAQLSIPERAALLDAQAEYLRGAALRLLGKRAEARSALQSSLSQLGGVRGGAVVSMNWLSAATLSELSLLEEAAGKAGAARQAIDGAVAVYARSYPGSAALLAARARLAGLLARSGDREGAIAIFRDVVAKSSGAPGGGIVTQRLLRPYFDALTAEPGEAARNAADYFAASQTLLRPGVAQTQAVFARELSGGSGEASTLFRQSVNLSRDIVRIDAAIAQLRAAETQDEVTRAALASQTARRETLGNEQTAVLARLAAFPKYRVVSNGLLKLADLQSKLRPGEGYFKVSLVGSAAFGIFVTANGADAYRLGMSPEELNVAVGQVRDTISRNVNGQQETSAFDAVTARRLYLALFGGVDDKLKATTHLIFEPDGALLQLPANLLIADQAGLDDYLKRIEDPDADAFDMRDVAWLGKGRMVTTSVSPQSFVDVRAIAPSRAKRRYLGLGQNAPALRVNAAMAGSAAPGACDWPLQAWSNPIAPGELRLAASVIGGTGNEVITGAAFSDDALVARADLADFRVLHFATHGLVTGPRPECPARPALMTSFGGAGSDGLLSFKEIFDLRLDADTIILSACDTAGEATVAASREAGIATGGNFALDGLVRAFVGAGARAVVASHWPVPDDFGATQRLMTGVFSAGTATSIGEAMRTSQQALMGDADTSHPYYWSGFAIIGDAAKPLISE